VAYFKAAELETGLIKIPKAQEICGLETGLILKMQLNLILI
jgi:hypothetical protein